MRPGEGGGAVQQLYEKSDMEFSLAENWHQHDPRVVSTKFLCVAHVLEALP